MIGAKVTPVVITGGKLKRLGERKWALGMHGEGGLRIRVAMVEALVVGRFEQFSSSYHGDTDLEDSQTQYIDASLVDRLFGVGVTVGVHY